MGLEPTNQRSQPIVRNIVPPQKEPFRLPRDWLEGSQPESFGNGLDEALQSSPGERLAMMKGRLHDQVGLFQLQLPWFLEPPASSQLTGASAAEA